MTECKHKFIERHFWLECKKCGRDLKSLAVDQSFANAVVCGVFFGLIFSLGYLVYSLVFQQPMDLSSVGDAILLGASLGVLTAFFGLITHNIEMEILKESEVKE